MAKVKGGLHSDSVGGAFGESMIFRKGKKSTTVTGYYKPGSAKKFDLSYPQLANRDKYGQIVQAWKALTTEQQEVFNENAKGTEMSGWNLFMKIYGESMGFKIALSIDPTKVGGALTDYVAYVDLSLLGDHFWSKVKNGGGDIRIKSADGLTEYAREIVSCDTIAKTGQLHTKLPNVSNTVATVFNIYYGDITLVDYAVTDTYGRNNVWTGKVCKYHFQDNASNTTVVDSKGANNGVSTRNTSIVSATGAVGKGLDFAIASSDYINIKTNSPINLLPASCSAFTFSIYFKFVASGSLDETLISLHKGEAIGNYNIGAWLMVKSTGLSMQIGMGNGSAREYETFGAISENTLYKVDMVFNNGNCAWYINGQFIKNTTWSLGSAVSFANTNYFRIGRTGTGAYWNSMLDEPEIVNGLKSSALISTSYNNEQSVSNFYSIGQYSYAKY